MGVACEKSNRLEVIRDIRVVCMGCCRIDNNTRSNNGQNL